MSAKASYIRLDFRVSSSARISLGNQYPRVSPLPHPSFPSSTISYSSFSVPLASCLAHRTSRLAPPRSATRQLINSLAHCPLPLPSPHLTLPPPPPSLSSIFSPSPPPPPAALPPPPFVLALRLFVLPSSNEAIPLHLAGSSSSFHFGRTFLYFDTLLHRASSTRHPSLINVI